MATVTAPLTQPSFWILTVLAAGRRHGYDILRETASASGGRVTLKAPTLYSTLERLETEGFIRADGEEIVAGRARRYFVITDDGTTRLTVEIESMEQAAKAARQQLIQHKFAFARGGAVTA